MIRLNPITNDDKELFHEIALRKSMKNGHCNSCKKRKEACNTCRHGNRGKMLRMEPYIEARYDFYMDHTDSLNEILPEWELDDEEEELLREAYRTSTAFKRIRKRIFEQLPDAVKGKCPYCMISEPNTLEHYFSEDLYPEYIIFTPNLIPCCSQCNTYKGERLFKNGERKAVHYYFDPIPDEQFLKAAVALDDGIPVVSFYLDFDEDVEINRIIKTQFEELRLFDRYKSQCNSVLSTLCETLRECLDSGMTLEACRVGVRAEIAALRKVNGNNYWQASLLEGVVSSKGVLEAMLR